MAYLSFEEPELVDMRTSMGYVKDYNYRLRTSYDDASGLKPADAQFDICLDMFRNDPVLSTALDIVIEGVTNNGFKFYGKNWYRC